MGVAYPLAGQRFDGIDSEEDSSVGPEEAAEVEEEEGLAAVAAAEAAAAAAAAARQQPPPRRSANGRGAGAAGQQQGDEIPVPEEPGCQAASVAVYAAADGSGAMRDAPTASSRNSGSGAGAAAAAGRPVGRRLAVASTSSLGEEEALRVLLLSSGNGQGLHSAFFGGDVSGSMDNIPEDVLAALAAGDARALDEVLSGAVGSAPTPRMTSPYGPRAPLRSAGSGGATTAPSSREPSGGGAAPAPLPPTAPRAVHPGMGGSSSARLNASGVSFASASDQLEHSLLAESVLRGSVTSAAFAGQHPVAPPQPPVLYGTGSGLLGSQGSRRAVTDQCSEAQPDHMDGPRAPRRHTVGAAAGSPHARALFDAAPGAMAVGSLTAKSAASPAARADNADMVLFGSPGSRRGVAADGAAAASPSPYLPPSPPLGADAAPYTATPMQHAARASSAAAAGAIAPEASLAGSHWLAAADVEGSQRSLHSLGGSLPGPGRATRSPVVSSSGVTREPSLQAFHQQQSQQVVYSSFVLGAMPPSPAATPAAAGAGSISPLATVSSHDLAIDDSGLPLPRWGRASSVAQQHAQPTVGQLPKAAFSRAAAAAAAADLGLDEPPPLGAARGAAAAAAGDALDDQGDHPPSSQKRHRQSPVRRQRVAAPGDFAMLHAASRRHRLMHD